MENVVEYVFVGVMFFLLFSCGFMTFNSSVDSYLDSSRGSDDLSISTYILHTLAPGGNLDPFTLQKLSDSCLRSQSSLYLSYDDLKTSLGLNEYGFSLSFMSVLNVTLSYSDGSLACLVSNLYSSKLCAADVTAYFFVSGVLNLSLTRHFEEGFGVFYVDFKPDFVLVFARSGVFFGLGWVGEVSLFDSMLFDGFLTLSSLPYGDGFLLSEGVIGGVRSWSLSEGSLTFYSQLFSSGFLI